MEKNYQLIEKEAHSLFSQRKFQEAYERFKDAADFHKRQGNHAQAALCFTSAASCFSIHAGEKTYYESGRLYEEAAKQALEYLDFEYAATLYKHAAINYERDREFLNFSECFYNSKECYRKFLFYSLIRSKKIHHIIEGENLNGLRGILRAIGLWLLLTVSSLVWGHGEKPSRTFYAAIFVVLSAMVFYTQGNLLQDGMIFRPRILESAYFSIVTFTTVGYGDIAPIGFNRLIAACEAFSGLFVIPLFLVGFTRKYLRV